MCPVRIQCSPTVSSVGRICGAAFQIPDTRLECAQAAHPHDWVGCWTPLSWSRGNNGSSSVIMSFPPAVFLPTKLNYEVILLVSSFITLSLTPLNGKNRRRCAELQALWPSQLCSTGSGPTWISPPLSFTSISGRNLNKHLHGLIIFLGIEMRTRCSIQVAITVTNMMCWAPERWEAISSSFDVRS